MPEKKPIVNSFSALSLAWELGYLITIPLVFFALLGRWADKTYHTSPLFMVIGLILALVVTSVAVYQKTVKLTSAIDNKNEKNSLR